MLVVWYSGGHFELAFRPPSPTVHIKVSTAGDLAWEGHLEAKRMLR